MVKSRDALMDAAYDDEEYVDDRTIDSHIKRLRIKFRANDVEFEQDGDEDEAFHPRTLQRRCGDNHRGGSGWPMGLFTQASLRLSMRCCPDAEAVQG